MRVNIMSFAVLILFCGCSQVSKIDPALATAPVVLPAATVTVMLENCDDGDGMNNWGGVWYSYNDSATGGISVVHPTSGALFSLAAVLPDWPGIPGSNLFAARMWGTIKKNAVCGYPLIGMGTNLDIQEDSEDLSAYKGMTFWAKNPIADSTTDHVDDFVISVKSGNNPSPSKFDYYSFRFTPGAVWQKFKIDFASFSASDWGSGTLDRAGSFSHATAFQFQTDTTATALTAVGSEKAVELWVDEITLYFE